MKAYTVHAYTTDSTEGVIVDYTGLKSEAELLQIWLQTPEGKETQAFCEGPENIIFVERPLLRVA